MKKEVKLGTAVAVGRRRRPAASQSSDLAGRDIELGEDLGDHAVEQRRLVGDVVVEAHRLDAEVADEASRPIPVAAGDRTRSRSARARLTDDDGAFRRCGTSSSPAWCPRPCSLPPTRRSTPSSRAASPLTRAMVGRGQRLVPRRAESPAGEAVLRESPALSIAQELVAPLSVDFAFHHVQASITNPPLSTPRGSPHRRARSGQDAPASFTMLAGVLLSDQSVPHSGQPLGVAGLAPRSPAPVRRPRHPGC